ncbi:MAG: putative hydrolase/acyltransferase, partial [uncultured Nocardioidaceae bacterium]
DSHRHDVRRGRRPPRPGAGVRAGRRRACGARPRHRTQPRGLAAHAGPPRGRSPGDQPGPAGFRADPQDEGPLGAGGVRARGRRAPRRARREAPRARHGQLAGRRGRDDARRQPPRPRRQPAARQQRRVRSRGQRLAAADGVRRAVLAPRGRPAVPAPGPRHRDPVDAGRLLRPLAPDRRDGPACRGAQPAAGLPGDVHGHGRPPGTSGGRHLPVVAPRPARPAGDGRRPHDGRLGRRGQRPACQALPCRRQRLAERRQPPLPGHRPHAAARTGGGVRGARGGVRRRSRTPRDHRV